MRRKIVGVNTLQITEKDSTAAKRLKVSPKLEADQVKRLKAFRKSRDSKSALASLARLEKAAKTSDQNLFPHILHAVESRATIGEIFATLRGVFGEYHGG